ncbi:MAG: D-2-hydroxyacid dehydrogenase [Oscillospiraceae bacterium]|nr:D-2-hydroxyacid dehydrogenase [Oscillospiraceae bacterium]
MKIVILEGHAVNPGDLSWEVLNEFGEITVYDRTAPEEAAARIGDAEIVLINKTPVTAELLDACPSVRLICVLATGYNVVDCCAAKERGVVVCNVPAYGTNAVAQFTFALLLELCHQAGVHSQAVHRGDWSRCPDFCFWYTKQTELVGKTIGIIGFGRIGQAVGKIANAFGMNVLAYNRSISESGKSIARYVSLDELLKQSDIISLHCPMTPETDKLINRQSIGKMKAGAMLLNTARGGLIDEEALALALATGKISGYAADVVSVEPISPSNPLLNTPNTILTPHMAWAPVESRQRIIDCTAKSIRGYLKGNPVNTVY